jgi:DUF1365 family protein
VSHTRTRPRRNAFSYSINYVAVSLDEIERGARTKLFAIDRASMFNLRSRDYGDGSPGVGRWIRNLFQRAGFEPNGEIVLLTLPRLFGYAFNPVSFWFCFDRKQRLRAALAEVNNTFGERHFYLCARDDRLPIDDGETLETAKEFRVSPFIEVKGTYRFQFTYKDDLIVVAINLADESGLLLITRIVGRPRPMTDVALLASVLRSPIQAFKVIALIHYQAAKLYAKRVRYFRKAWQPGEQVRVLKGIPEP